MKVWSHILICLALQNTTVTEICLGCHCRYSAQQRNLRSRKPKLLEVDVPDSWELQIRKMEPEISRTLCFTESQTNLVAATAVKRASAPDCCIDR